MKTQLIVLDYEMPDASGHTEIGVGEILPGQTWQQAATILFEQNTDAAAARIALEEQIDEKTYRLRFEVKGEAEVDDPIIARLEEREEPAA